MFKNWLKSLVVQLYKIVNSWFLARKFKDQNFWYTILIFAPKLTYKFFCCFLARKFKMRLFEIVFKHCDLKKYIYLEKTFQQQFPSTLVKNKEFFAAFLRKRFSRFSIRSSDLLTSITLMTLLVLRSKAEMVNFPLHWGICWLWPRLTKNAKTQKMILMSISFSVKRKTEVRRWNFFCCFYKIPFSSCKTRVRLVKNSCSIWHWR